MKVLPDDAVLHQAVRILRREIGKIENHKDFYFSSGEMSVDGIKKFVNPKLLTFLVWLTNKSSFDGAVIQNNSDELKKCLNIACDIITLSTGTFSPKHLGLAMELYHNFGSRKLNELVYHLGYSVSYSELRRFLTSASSYIAQVTTQSKLQIYLPPEFKSKVENCGFVVCAADNWDHNEKTVDGKRTTHAMTSILIQEGHTSSEVIEFSIERLPENTLNSSSLEIDLTKVIHYKKPPTRPEPELLKTACFSEIESISDTPELVSWARIEELYNLVISDFSTNDDFPTWSHY